MTAKIPLDPDPEQAITRFSLHHLLYHSAREKFGLSARIVVRLFAKVTDAYQKDKMVVRRLGKHGAGAYDARILSFREGGYKANADYNAALNIRGRGNRQLANRSGGFYSPAASYQLSAGSR